MTTPAAERYARAHELFDAVVELAPQERTTLLDERCGDDEALRREVETLLEADAQTDDLDAQPAFAIPPDIFEDAEEEEFAGRHFGPYEVVREIGRGGLGSVYLAIRSDGEYRKEVALKLIRRGLDTEDILRRFRNERQILAQLDHPNIARLIDGGTTDDGLPYFVMEYVKGDPITDYCNTGRLGTNERLDLFRKVCAAVTYAHQNLVIHRDLKPSNILVTAEGEPKLLDFGIAKLLTADDELMLTQTAPGQRAMTPEYASPEQIKGEKITTASDIYSLGVLLYELLTGERPYRLKTRTPEEVARAITDQEPERPSTAVARAGKSQFAIRHSSFPQGDLDNIVLMALRKEPERRYTSAGQLSEDIRRHLDGRPVIAHKDTFRYRATKFIRRNAVGATAATVVLLTLISGILATGWQAKRATNQAQIAQANASVASAERHAAQQERDRAQREAIKSARINAFLQNILGLSDPTSLGSNPRGNAGERTISDAIDEAGRRAEAELADEPEVLAGVHYSIGRIFATQGRIDRSEAHLRASLDLRREALGSLHHETAQSMCALGEQLSAAGKTAEAQALLQEAANFYRGMQMKNSVDLKWFAIALNGLGNAQMMKGDAVAGGKFLLEAVEAASGLSGADRAFLPTALNNLGMSRSEQGDIEGAIAYLQRALEEHRQSKMDLRFHKATALSNLGFQLLMKGDYAGAESVLHESIDIFRATVGEEYQLAAFPLIHLASVHYQRAEYESAKQQIEHVLEVQKRTRGEGHIDIARSWVVLGKTLTRTGDATAGESYLRRAVELRTKILSPNHWRTAEAQTALADCLLEQGRFPKAETLLIASRPVFEKKLGAADARSQENRRLLRRLYETWGKPEQAAQFE